MKKLVMLTNDINQYGGIETVISTLCSCFVKKGINVTIVSLYSSDIYKKISDVDSKLEIIHLAVTDSKKVTEQLKRFFTNYDFDILMTFHATIAFSVSKIIRFFPHIYWIATEHSSPSFYTWKRILLNVYAYGRADKFVVLNKSVKKFYSKFFLNNIEIIHNAISFQTDKTAEYENRNIIAVGRLEKVKRFDRVIKAFHSISDQYPEWQMNIVGSGSEMDNLNTLIKELKEERIYLLGYRTDIKDLMLNSSFLVISSESEGFSLVALEGMECGLPVVSTELPGIREIDSNCNAVLFSEQNDIDRFAEHMKLLMSDEKMIYEIGKNAKQCAKKYHPDIICQRWLQLFNRME